MLKSLWQGGIAKIGAGCGREDANLELFEFLALEDETEAENDKERKGKIPAKGGAITEKFSISGLKDGPHSLQIHGVFIVDKCL